MRAQSACYGMMRWLLAFAYASAPGAVGAAPTDASAQAQPCPTYAGPVMRVRAFGDVLSLPSYLLLTPDAGAAPGTARVGFSRVVSGRDDEYVGSIKYGDIVQAANTAQTSPAGSKIDGDVILRAQRGALRFTVVALPRPLPHTENPIDAVLVVQGAGTRAEFWSGDGAEEALAVFNRWFDESGAAPGACLRAPPMPVEP